MPKQDWLVTEAGNCIACESPRQWDLLIPTTQYRFYRFLCELEDILEQAEITGETEAEFLPNLRRLVRKLILNVYWVNTRIPEPSPKTETGVLLLYDELGYPITIQTEIMLPGTSTTIHNHGTWGVVATLKGQQKNTFWQRIPTSEFPHKIDKVEEKVLESGDIIALTTEAIHCVEAVGDEPSITLNIYGDTYPAKRFQFDALTNKARNF
ncbi:cupin [Aphanothece sacrum]|uniref:Cupin n=1 Tax=Aphanothece sacrum FPU1 TaxID=1920663 RepID=A0A401IFH0_APHSA|nr:cupin [Aphanothece sacrum]GBF79971.1 cupin [Aphanothece sacrum FPU1]GBF83809.1 cupin [Aphanothece sacrum FPU3]